jgi:hypothetical protein
MTKRREVGHDEEAEGEKKYLFFFCPVKESLRDSLNQAISGPHANRDRRFYPLTAHFDRFDLSHQRRPGDEA